MQKAELVELALLKIGRGETPFDPKMVDDYRAGRIDRELILTAGGAYGEVPPGGVVKVITDAGQMVFDAKTDREAAGKRQPLPMSRDQLQEKAMERAAAVVAGRNSVPNRPSGEGGESSRW